MATPVKTPVDTYYALGEMGFADTANTRRISSKIWDDTIIAPTSYSVKRSSVFIASVEGIHPAFYYTGLDYSSIGGSLYTRVQPTKSNFGVEGSISIPNPKAENMKTSLIGDVLPVTSGYEMMDDVPIHYYGHEVDSKLPNDTTKNSTFLTRVIDESYVKVKMDSPYEFTIEVVASPSEDQWFYVPVANAKGLSSTIWGKVGYESTLPAGACAGLIKVYSEAWLTTAQGDYTVTGDQLLAVKLGKNVVIDEQSYRSDPTLVAGRASSRDRNSSRGGLLGYDANFQQAEAAIGFNGTAAPSAVLKSDTDTFLTIPQITTLNELIQNQVNWYVLGYKTGACTVGTGLFARNSSTVDGVAQTVIYPYASTTDGISVIRTFTQDPSNPVYKVRMGDLLDCGSNFLESVATMAKAGQVVKEGIVIPLCASDLQHQNHTAGPSGSYMIPNAVNFRYAQPSFDSPEMPVQTTPVYIPSGAKYHCYVPKLCSVPVTRYHVLRVSDLSEEVNLGLVFQPEILSELRISESVPPDTVVIERAMLISKDRTNSKSPDDIVSSANTILSGLSPTYGSATTYKPVAGHPYNLTTNPELKYVDSLDPTEGYFYDQAGFYVQKCVSGFDVHGMQTYAANLNDFLTGSTDSLTMGSSYNDYYGACASYKIKYTWGASSSGPVVGKEATSSDKTLGAGATGMVMVFAGYIPAGSTPGVYKFKPLSSTQSVSGGLSCDPAPAYVETGVTGEVKLSTTEAPYIGLNFIHAESPNLRWDFDTQTDAYNNYTYYRVLLSVAVDKSQRTSTDGKVLVALNPEHVPLAGYPVAGKPVLMQIDDASGIQLNDMDDLCITNPFFDETVQDWVVIGASVKHGKMYKVKVEMDPTNSFVTDFKTVVNSAELMDTPYGRFTDLLGLSQAKDIHYYDEKSEEAKKAMAADILFLVDDSGSMPAAMTELKANINNMFNTLYNTGVDDIRVGIACYDTQQESIRYSGTGAKWATDVTQAQDMANQLQTSFITTSTDRSAWHWSAIQWALLEYTFRDVKSKYIVLITDAGYEKDPKTQADVKPLLMSGGIILDVISKADTEFDPIVYDTDGTFISMKKEGSDTWGVVMSNTLGSKIISEIKATYTISVADDHLVIYGITSAEESSIVHGSNLVVATCRTSMEWDSNKDTIVRIKVKGTDENQDYIIKDTDNWPRGIAVLFPYLYVLGYNYTKLKSAASSMYEIKDEDFVEAKFADTSGWQMCMWKIDMTAGVVSDPIIIKDAACMRYHYGIPALSSKARSTLTDEVTAVGGKYLALFNIKNVTSPSSSISIAVSDRIPSKSSQYDFPALSGLCGVAGQLFAFSNYHETPVLINPLTGTVETTGLSIFPLSYPFNANIGVKGETLCSIARFGDANFYFTQPFYQLCISDGVSPNMYSMGIDVHDITTGSELVRKCYVRNNNLRDRLEKITLSVPLELILPGSEMLYLSLTGEDADKSKSITFPNELHPCETAAFFLHVIPTQSYADENLVMYLNAKFSRVTEYFGYLNS